MWIAYHNDGKGKSQSHEMYFKEDSDFARHISDDIYINSHDISDILVYGDTKDDCLLKLSCSLDYLIRELIALKSNIAFGITPIREVDGCGELISEED